MKDIKFITVCFLLLAVCCCLVWGDSKKNKKSGKKGNRETNSAETATVSETKAEESAQQAVESAQQAAESAKEAKVSALKASNAQKDAETSAADAEGHANNAKQYSFNAAQSASRAQSALNDIDARVRNAIDGEMKKHQPPATIPPPQHPAQEPPAPAVAAPSMPADANGDVAKTPSTAISSDVPPDQEPRLQPPYVFLVSCLALLLVGEIWFALWTKKRLNQLSDVKQESTPSSKPWVEQSQFDSLKKGLEETLATHEHKFEQLDQRTDGLQEKIGSMAISVQGSSAALDSFERRFEEFKGRFDKGIGRVLDVDERLGKFSSVFGEHFEILSLQEELKKAGKDDILCMAIIAFLVQLTWFAKVHRDNPRELKTAFMRFDEMLFDLLGKDQKTLQTIRNRIWPLVNDDIFRDSGYRVEWPRLGDNVARNKELYHLENPSGNVICGIRSAIIRKDNSIESVARVFTEA